MKKTLVAFAAAAGTLVAGAATASAEDTTPLAKVITSLAYRLDGQHYAQPDWTSTVSDLESFEKPETCWKAFKDSGVGPNDKVFSDGAFRFKSVQKEGDKYFVLGKDVEAFCKRYEDFYVHEYVESAVMAAWQQQDMMKRPVEGAYEADAQRVGIAGRLCTEWVDKALAYGFKPTDKVESSRYRMPTVELGKAKELYCQPAVDFEAKRVAEIKALADAKHQAIVDVYKKAGIKGKRLELYVSYGMPDNTGFYAAGCGSTVESLPALKKAKKLFIWLEGAQGYTIRKFTFKGDNYTVSERTYTTQEGAYSGCR
ncbi:MAG TPA: hypothetical protein VM261_38620 [Kofleriaceae bacterium]|nr:hypothetical protein [Kofleriaceae bacterium]